MWGLGGSWFVGVLLPAQDHFANRIAIQLAPSLTNTFGGRMHVGEKYRPIKSDGEEEGLTDLISTIVFPTSLCC